MRFRLPLSFTSILLLTLLCGCQGEDGTDGAEGAEGPIGTEGPPAYEEPAYTYLGGNGNDCRHCHQYIVSNWAGTNHQDAFVDLGTDNIKPGCLQCHTTGWDSEVSDDTISVRGPDTTGFDDYFMVATNEAFDRRAALAGVQCEACHGPLGPEVNQSDEDISFSTRQEDDKHLSICAPCHARHLTNWNSTGHGTAQTGSIEEFNSRQSSQAESCQSCHTSEGFIRANDPAYAIYDFPDQKSFIGCVTCHDPHSDEVEHLLRKVGNIEVEYHPAHEDGDPGIPMLGRPEAAELCSRCHHAPKDNDDVENQIRNGDPDFGPHHSPQMDMFIGAGCYEIEGKAYIRNHLHRTNIEDKCVKCHMKRKVYLTGETQQHVFHTFELEAGNCAPCHIGLTDFDYNGTQTEIQAKMYQLAAALGYVTTTDFLENFDSQATGVRIWEREAAYALFFVYNDGSKGVHNPVYALTLLQNAIDYIGENTD